MPHTGDPDEEEEARKKAQFYKLTDSQKRFVMAQGNKELAMKAAHRRLNRANIEADDNVSMKKTFKRGRFSGYAPKDSKSRLQQIANQSAKSRGSNPLQIADKAKETSRQRQREDWLKQAISRRKGRGSGGTRTTVA